MFIALFKSSSKIFTFQKFFFMNYTIYCQVKGRKKSSATKILWEGSLNPLNCAENPVTGVTESRQNITIFVKPVINRRRVNRYVRMFRRNFFNSLRRGNYAHKNNFLCAFILQHLQSR